MFSTKRFAVATALAFPMAISFGQTAYADTEVGRTGNHVFVDDASHPGATCKYQQDRAQPQYYWIHTITAAAPSVWWPDTDSTNTSEHGVVGWRFAVQVSTSEAGPWKTVAHSSYQKKTAYEDQLRRYDPRKAAPLTSMSVSFDGKSYGGALWRIVTRAIWYRSGGGVLGYVKHVVVHYREKWSDNSVNGLYPYCDPLFQVF